MPKDTSSLSHRQKHRHNPLHEEILANGLNGHGILRDPSSRSKRKQKLIPETEEYVESGLSKKILKLAREQQDEIEVEELTSSRRTSRGSSGGPGRGSSSSPFGSAHMRLAIGDGEDTSDEEYEDESFFEDEAVEEVVVDEADLELFNKYLPPAGGPSQSLADKILAKIAEHEARTNGVSGPGEGDSEHPPINPKIVEVYTKVGLLLSRYKSGKIPKPFKIIPSLKNWEEVLFLTRPDQWSPNACYAATKLFVSNLKSSQTQKFMSLILLDRIRDDIHEHKKLNVHLYKCLKKSLYKPAAFFKGFLFPLCQSGTCTLKEAQIISSVLTRVSIPVLHSAAALLRLTEMANETPYTGPTSIFIKTLLDKKYALPYKVIDALVFHFMRFKSFNDRLPLLWHQSFLSFAQRYKNDITEDQRDALLDVLLIKGHALVGPEIRRELLEGRGRGNNPEQSGMALNGVVVGINGAVAPAAHMRVHIRPEDDLMMDVN